MYVANRALAVDQHRDRHRVDFIKLADFLARIEQHWEIDPELLDHLHCTARIVVDVNAEQIEADAIVATVQLVEQRHFLPAWKRGPFNTILIGSSLQAAALSLFVFFDSQAQLYLIAALFGLVFGGIVPAYGLAVRELLPARMASSTSSASRPPSS